MNNDITIIFVLYKSGNILYENLKELKNFKKIIIDNNPSSTIETELKLIDKNIVYKKMNSNLGMSKAAKIALDSVNTNFFLYLTADTIINEKNILNLLTIYKKYPNIGLVAPIHLDKKGDYSGNYFCHPLKRIINRNKFNKNIYKSLSKLLPEGDFSVSTVWGAPILLKTSLIKEIGFFDQNFFMYFEDVDLCDRIIDKGLEIIETPFSFCHHHKGSSNIKSINNLYTTISSYKFSELYYFSKFKIKYRIRIYIHSFDYFFRLILNVVLFNKLKIFSNLFRLVGIIRFIFYKKISKF